MENVANVFNQIEKWLMIFKAWDYSSVEHMLSMHKGPRLIPSPQNKNRSCGAEEIAQQLGACTGFAEDLSSIPNILF